ncbi:MAG: hypothetical protein K0R58_229 [Ramlibacter sp.]|jgi:hypothetical protein|nr:hypothetical protein [Ramlibacter sp.]
MAEPTSTTGAAGAALVAIGVGLVGSKYGALATVAAGALIGAFISLGEVGTPGGRWAGFRYLLQYTIAASLTAGTLSYLIERYTAVPATEILVLVAFCIGWIGGRWQGILNAVLSAASTLFGRKAGGQ